MESQKNPYAEKTTIFCVACDRGAEVMATKDGVKRPLCATHAIDARKGGWKTPPIRNLTTGAHSGPVDPRNTGGKP